MKTVGIICEYNPFHLGHKKQIDKIRREQGPDCGIVCLMSGNYVQRGDCAIFDKSLRAQAALKCGADLVLELPITYALSSAEGFAAGGVRILSGFCDGLSFGTENGDAQALRSTARALLSPEFPPALKEQLQKGLSFPAARQAALSSIGIDDSLLTSPNDILAVEYTKAILSQNADLELLPIRRSGSYHDTVADPENPSATALRSLICAADRWQGFVPDAAAEVLKNAPIHTRSAGERAILTRLRSMTDEEFELLPYGSEGLWRKLMYACRECATIEQIITQTKSKRYTRTRLERMILCAFLGISREMLEAPAPYARVLGFTGAGAAILKQARKTGIFPHVGDKMDSDYQLLEDRADRLYSLFSQDPTPSAICERRVVIEK